MVGKKGSIYLKRTCYLPSVIKFYKPVENKVFSLLTHPWSEVVFSLSLLIFLQFSKEIYHERILRQSFGHWKHFSNNQHQPFPGVKFHFDSAQITLGKCLISFPHGEHLHQTTTKQPPNNNKPLTCFPLSGFQEHELSHETGVAWFLRGVGEGDVGS